MRHADAAVVLFTLTPEAEGARKPLGLRQPRDAAAVFATLLEHVAAVCAGVPGADLVVASESRVELPVGACQIRQRGEDFGTSLRLAVEDAFALGYRRVIVIGNDAPEITRAYLKSALDALSGGEREAVIGPARDGGYNLLGLTSPERSVFEAMPWSSGDVLRLTVERLRAEGFAVCVLAPLDDIDDAHALASFLERVERHGRRAHVSLRRLVARLRRLTTGATSVVGAEPLPRKVVSPSGVPGLRAPPALS